MLMQHGGWGIGADDMTPVGIWTSLAEDGIGLKVEGKLADTPRGREAYALLKMTPRPARGGVARPDPSAKAWSTNTMSGPAATTGSTHRPPEASTKAVADCSTKRLGERTATLT